MAVAEMLEGAKVHHPPDVSPFSVPCTLVLEPLFKAAPTHEQRAAYWVQWADITAVAAMALKRGLLGSIRDDGGTTDVPPSCGLAHLLLRLLLDRSHGRCCLR